MKIIFGFVIGWVSCYITIALIRRPERMAVNYDMMTGTRWYDAGVIGTNPVQMGLTTNGPVIWKYK